MILLYCTTYYFDSSAFSAFSASAGNSTYKFLTTLLRRHPTIPVYLYTVPSRPCRALPHFFRRVRFIIFFFRTIAIVSSLGFCNWSCNCSWEQLDNLTTSLAQSQRSNQCTTYVPSLLE